MAVLTDPLRVLYIDDDEMALTLTQLQLLNAGIHTETTADALEAVSILATENPTLILLDSVMPTIDGVEFLQLMRSLQFEYPVVFFTGHGVEELAEAVQEFDILGILDKQKDRMALPERLQSLYAAHCGGMSSGLSPSETAAGHPAAS
jgi:CheY-like chemotaxis protein